ncbi:MAG: CDGSH iron-sulfur domain-containing protein [Candidatus Absconditabacteria bacterium]|nr:CDGSH iron-sulfur domain-containing protein [Candidatus Absconditabacteria bacterium]MDD3868514.1 CDGSH iron-sulfur domain-containing protein [Candidatus Absconditabacteria bacterium]MDD4713890.1 CDGSH iron-sulfur domain-containing protein [Candidatus Absconditabacteria bacterium]
MTDKKIRILPKGPYEVSGNIPIRQEIMINNEEGTPIKREKGKEYPSGETSYLCRCGHTNNIPFCDGTHGKIGFEGTEYAEKKQYEEAAKRYLGEEVDMLDQQNLCAIARFCHLGKDTRNSVIHHENEKDTQNAMQSASNCPAGRLTILQKEGKSIEPILEPEIGLIEDRGKNYKGPLRIQGGIPIESSDGEGYPIRNRVTLCRCGTSQNMPFCDGKHLKCAHMEGIST